MEQGLFLVLACVHLHELNSNDNRHSDIEYSKASSSARLKTIGEFRGLNGVPTTVDLSFAAQRSDSLQELC